MRTLLIFILLFLSQPLHSPPSTFRYDNSNCHRILFIQSIIHIESKGDPSAQGSKDDIGILQITPICVKEANRILNREIYTLNDRYDHKKSIEIFNIIQDHHNPDFDYHRACKIWNPGAGRKYANSILKEYRKRINKLSNCYEIKGNKI